MRLENALRDVSRIMLDTAPAIYYLERNPRYVPTMESFFRIRARREITLVTSPITLVECIIHPLRLQRLDLEGAYYRLITAGEDTVFQTLGAAEAREAARLRAAYGLRLADAFQAAVATLSNCQAVLTNDPIFKRLTEIRALIVDELEP